MLDRNRKNEINRGLTCLARLARECGEEVDYNREADVASILREAALYANKRHRELEGLLLAELQREREEGPETPEQQWDRMVEANRVK